jgi:hypothetical protein
MDIQSASAQASSQEGRKWKGAAMEIKHPSYYKKLKQERKAARAQANKSASAQAGKPASAQASNGSRINKR